jgi:hypothetical protein
VTFLAVRLARSTGFGASSLQRIPMLCPPWLRYIDARHNLPGDNEPIRLTLLPTVVAPSTSSGPMLSDRWPPWGGMLIRARRGAPGVSMVACAAPEPDVLASPAAAAWLTQKVRVGFPTGGRIWASPALTDIHHQGFVPGRMSDHEEHGKKPRRRRLFTPEFKAEIVELRGSPERVDTVNGLILPLSRSSLAAM